jgi:hypothetical protein
MNDLPPRTWRSWWLAWPKWFRIGCWAAADLTVLHLALAVRIYYGLQEPAEITALRNRHGRVVYFLWDQSEWFRHHLTLVAGLHGKSWRNIAFIEGHRLTADELSRIRLRCPSLHGLSLDDVTPEILAEVLQFRQLKELYLGNTDVDDDMVLQLAELKNLIHLSMHDTLITDEAMRVIEHLPRLEQMDVVGTDVTESAFAMWTARRESLCINRSFDGFHCAIRWSDETRSPGVPQGYRYRTIWSEPGKPPFTFTSSNGLYRRLLHSNAILSNYRAGDGDYTMALRIGDYDATPVTVTLKDGQLSWHTLEFQMPCTKAEALRSAESKAQE